ncbi:nucleoside deaminase [Streptomyces sp. Je 1-369]|uniref:nucleoside deaminase n=1 Tax=Streptomyces sp. Je 1-369 TaxID=2966192 RepID=UPI00228559E8|nr:nucleoside deaminase [Streptomyces sp. Je 1-369]WAL95720.1 nucleoside deaminase [Streptomyces sp. Je 1-369]
MCETGPAVNPVPIGGTPQCRMTPYEEETPLPYAPEQDHDRAFLDQAIAQSRRSLDPGTKKPFGAVVVVGGEVVGVGSNCVVEDCDPTAHAEVVALRDAGRRLGTFLVEGGTLYSSCEPCPMCLTACYWAGISRLVYAADRHDAARNGHPDLQFYRELALPNGERRLLDEVPVEGDVRAAAVGVLAEWAAEQPGPVEPKL